MIIHPSAWLERYQQIHMVSGKQCSESYATRCPNLRGPREGGGDSVTVPQSFPPLSSQEESTSCLASWLTSRSAAAAPSAAMPAPTKNAHLYPTTSASALSSPPRVTASVRATATAKRTANPKAVPTCAELFRRPEASPRASSLTAEVPQVVEATAEQPSAKPERAAFATT